MKQTQRGFIGIAIVIIAALTVGGGVYYAYKTKEATRISNMASVSNQMQSDTTNQGSGQTAVGINTSVLMRPLDNGTTSTHMTLEQLLGLNDGRILQCTSRVTNAQGTVINSTAYINGSAIRGDSSIVSGDTTTMSSLILKDGMLYSWTGSVGMKMKVSASFNLRSLLSASGQAATQDYACTPWTVDVAKFTVPTSVRFTDYGAVTVPTLQ